MHPFVTDLRAFHGDPAIKATYLARVEAHAAADEIVQGQYWESGRGCAVGCTIHGSDHSAYERELGIPQILARLEDRLFETMSLPDAKAWPARFLRAVPVGADLSLVWPRFAVWLLVDGEYGVLRHAQTDRTRDSIQAVGNLYRRVVAGESVSRDEFVYAADAGAAPAAYTAAACAYADDAAYAACAYDVCTYDARRAFARHAGDELLRLMSTENSRVD